MSTAGGGGKSFVVEEADVGRRSAVERCDVDDVARARRRRQRFGARQGDDLIKRKTARVL